MFGWVGLVFLLLAYTWLNTNRKVFLILDIVSCIFIVIHSSINRDIPIGLINVYILVICIVGLFKEVNSGKTS